jgi:hypothetical protein
LARTLSLSKAQNPYRRDLLHRSKARFVETPHRRFVDQACFVQVAHHFVQGCQRWSFVVFGLGHLSSP